jgi:hypothetical protein
MADVKGMPLAAVKDEHYTGWRSRMRKIMVILGAVSLLGACTLYERERVVERPAPAPSTLIVPSGTPSSTVVVPQGGTSQPGTTVVVPQSSPPASETTIVVPR